MTTLIAELRKPRIDVLGRSVAVFDTAGTAFIAYAVADRMKWNKPLTVGSAFVLGHLVHQMVGVKTAFNPEGEGRPPEGEGAEMEETCCPVLHGHAKY